MKTIFLSAVLNVLGGIFHPMHISVCEMQYDENRRALEITQKVFIDDLELEMRRETKDETLVLTELTSSRVNELLKQYLKKHILIFIDKNKQDFNYVGYEFEREAVYIYFEVTGLSNPKTIGMKNDILLNFYDDQVNLVHVEKGNNLKSFKLEGMIIQGEVQF